MDKVIIKDKQDKKKMKVKQPFKFERDYETNQIQNMDSHNVEDYHDYERMFDTKVFMGKRRNDMDNVILKKAEDIDPLLLDDAYCGSESFLRDAREEIERLRALIRRLANNELSETEKKILLEEDTIPKGEDF